MESRFLQASRRTWKTGTGTRRPCRLEREDRRAGGSSIFFRCEPIVHELLNTRRTRIVHVIEANRAVFAMAQAESRHALHLPVGRDYSKCAARTINIY